MYSTKYSNQRRLTTAIFHLLCNNILDSSLILPTYFTKLIFLHLLLNKKKEKIQKKKLTDHDFLPSQNKYKEHKSLKLLSGSIITTYSIFSNIVF